MRPDDLFFHKYYSLQVCALLSFSFPFTFLFFPLMELMCGKSLCCVHWAAWRIWLW